MAFLAGIAGYVKRKENKITPTQDGKQVQNAPNGPMTDFGFKQKSFFTLLSTAYPKQAVFPVNSFLFLHIAPHCYYRQSS